MAPKTTTTRWTAISGLVFVAAWVVGLLIESSSPGPAASYAQLKGYYLAHQQAQMVQSYLIDGVAGLALLAFAAALRGVWRDQPGEDGVLADVAFGAGVAAASVSLVQAALGEMLAYRAVLEDPAGTLIVFGVLNTADTFKLLAIALLAAATAIPIQRTRALPIWLGWLGAALAILLVVGGLSFPLNSAALYVVLYVALPLLLVWVGALSVVILRRGG
jgi:hypothetical protein